MTTILGIDPGSRITGYGIIKENTQTKKLHYIDSGCIRTNSEKLSHRLMEIYTGICELIEKFCPDEMAIEEIFLAHNPSSALKLGHARGVAIVASAKYLININEYSAREVKQALVGFGAAKKEQVKHMVINMLALNKAPQNDAADALAIAICHIHMKNGLSFKRYPQRRRRK